MTTCDDLRSVLRDLEARPRGSLPPEAAREGWAVFRSIAREHPYPAPLGVLARQCLLACLRASGLSVRAGWTVTDWRAVPVDLLQVQWGPVYEASERVKYGEAEADSIPGIAFTVTLEPCPY